MTTPYLPQWATAEEAATWLQVQTGEPWSLPRLLEAGFRPHIWLTPDGVSRAELEHVFDNRHEGFMAEVSFAGDTHRMAADRTGVVSMTRTPRGELIQFTPPITFDIDQLRFSASEVCFKNDKPPRISQAPEPITPVRGRGGHNWSALAPARWALWKLMPSVELWQAVCLSLNIEPEERLTSRGLTSRGPSKHVALPTDFWDRLTVCQARVSSTNGPIHPQGALYRGMLTDPTCPVLQAEVAAFLVSVGLPVPEEMRPGGDVAALGRAVGTRTEQAPASDGPRPLTTGDIAFCFAGLRGWDESKWKKSLGNKPKWLEACIAIPGQRGVSERRWNPVLIAAELVRVYNAQPHSVRARFQSKPMLKPWLDTWKTYEADHIDND